MKNKGDKTMDLDIAFCLALALILYAGAPR